MSGSQLIWVAAAMGIAALVQSLSGFGFALLAVPLMSLAVDVRTGVVVSTLVAMATTAVHAWSERSHCDVRLARSLLVSSFVGMPFGFLIFLFVPLRGLKIGLGAVVIVISLMLVMNVAVPAGSRLAERIAGVTSGMLATSLSTNGPPLVFILQGRSLSPEVFRGTISRVFAVVNVVTIVMFVGAGRVGHDALWGSIAVLPVVALFTRIGYAIRPSMNGARFRVLVIVLLVSSGISAIVTAL